MKPVFRALPSLVLAAAVASAQQGSYSGVGAGSLPQETIAKYAPPPLPAEITRRIQTMLDVRAPGLGVVSPDGRRLFFGWSVTGSPQVWRLDGPRSYPVQMTGGEDRTSVVDLTPDGKWLILLRDVGGQENPGLYLQAVGGGPLKTIQKIDKVQTFYDFVTDDSKTIYFHSNDVKPDAYAIYRYDVATGERSLVFGEPGLWSIADHRGTGNDLRLLFVKQTGALSTEYHEWSAATKKAAPLLGVGETTEYAAGYGPAPGELFVQTNRFGEFRRLYRWKIGPDATEKAFRPVSPDVKMDVSGFTIDDARAHVYLTMNDGGYTRLRVLDARTLAPKTLPLPENADHLYTGLTSRDGRFVTVGVETAQAPRSSYVWDWKTKTLTQWVVPSAPEVDLSAFVPAKLMSYPARDGTPIPMFARLPKGCAPQENSTADPCPVSSSFTAGRKVRRSPDSRPTRSSSSRRGSWWSSPTSEAAMGTASGGWTQTTARSAST